MKKLRYIVILLFVIVLGTGCSNDEKQEEFLSDIAVQDVDISIENLSLNTTYDKMTNLGKPNALVPVEDEAIIINKGYYVTVEYDGLIVTLNAEKNFDLTSSSSIVAVTALSDAYTDSYGMRVGMSKEELMRQFSFSENDLMDKENAEIYRIPDTNFISHNIPIYDSFYVIENVDVPIVLIYLIKDDYINGILLRHLTAD